MPFHQKLLTGVLILLTGMLLGVLMMIMRGNWIPPERVQVRYTEVLRSAPPVDSLTAPVFSGPTTLFRDIAESVIPAVVYIETEIAMQQAVPDDEHHNFENQFWDRFLPRRRAQSIGSGVLVSSDGYILTNHHVIQGADNRIRVMTHDRRQYQATIVGSDPSTDLAVIKIETSDASPIIIGNSDYVNIGDWVMAVGNPFRLRSTVTAGIVSAVGRDVDIISDRMRIESFIQTDAAINRGNSGGALVNTMGELIGINTAIASESGTYQGYGFAVPVNMAMKIGQDMIEFGSVQRAFLGVEIASVEYEQARRHGLSHVSGVEVRSVVPRGSADLGGLKRGDVILAVNDFPVDAANRLQERIALMRPGEEVTLSVWRNKKDQQLRFPLLGLEDETIREWASAAPPQPQPMDFGNETESGVPQKSFDAGFTLAELAILEEMSRNELVVVRVEPGSASHEAGIREEDVVTHVEETPVESLDQFTAAWQNKDGQEIAVHVLRESRTLTITIPAH
ncbi:MAG: Do family serine endopeptidase [Balneolaceae bacterium]|nr:MAG: Do family serine endopeptidase [Balneolaceae bacterium]